MSEPFFFGPRDAQRFGVYHAPAGGGRLLTVICPPLFSEYMRTHLALRELALALAAKGQHVLRFDYRGTGDSSGALADMAVTHWLDDIALAVQEGRELAGCAAVQLVGVRAGALLACLYAGGRDDVERLVLWDPVGDGPAYLRALERVQAGILERNRYLGRDRRKAAHEHGGYRLSGRMVEEFRLLGPGVYAGVAAEKLRVVTTSPAGDLPLADAIRAAAHVASAWETDLEEPILPRLLLERLTACLTPA